MLLSGLYYMNQGFNKRHFYGRLPWWLSSKRILMPMQEMQVRSLGQEEALEKDQEPTPVFLPGKSTGRGAWQAVYSLWGHQESDHD